MDKIILKRDDSNERLRYTNLVMREAALKIRYKV